jgi:hypothetical protein
VTSNCGRNLIVARIAEQDDNLRKEFLKRIQAKVQNKKDLMHKKADEELPSFLSKVLKPVLGVAFDYYRGIEKLKGNVGETNVSVKLRLGLPGDWVLMNDVIVEPAPDVFAQTDHILIGPPGLFVIETKAWQGAFTGFNDKWKRREGNKWVHCESPTAQNLRHVILIKKWIEKTGLVKVDRHHNEWIKAAVVFTQAQWLKTDGCCMPVFDGVLDLIVHLRKQNESILNPTQINNIINLLIYPRVAKAYINNQVQTLDVDEPPKAPIITYSSSSEDKKRAPLIENGKAKNGKKFIRITGEYKQAEEVRDKYIKEGQRISQLKKDKFKQGVFYFYLES